MAQHVTRLQVAEKEQIGMDRVQQYRRDLCRPVDAVQP